MNDALTEIETVNRNQLSLLIRHEDETIEAVHCANCAHNTVHHQHMALQTQPQPGHG